MLWMCFWCFALRNTVFSSSILLFKIPDNRVGQKGYVLSSITTAKHTKNFLVFQFSCSFQIWLPVEVVVVIYCCKQCSGME